MPRRPRVARDPRAAGLDRSRRRAPSADAILERLLALHPKAIDLVARPHRARCWRELGNPQDALPPVIHVAGTNGKGSTVRLSARHRSRRPACASTSTPRRIWCASTSASASPGELIAEDALARAARGVEAANGGEPITFFEITTAAAFLAFAAHSGRRLRARGRARRPARRDQRHRAAARRAITPISTRPSGVSSATRWRRSRREGRHHQARRARHHRAAAGRGRAVIDVGPKQSARRSSIGRSATGV